MKATARGAATTQKLLDTALAIFDRDGLEGLTVHAVVAKSGVSLGSLYHHFGSADGLATALYLRCLGAWLDAVADGLEGCAGARAVVVAIVEGYLDFAANEPTMARFVHASSYASYLPKNAAVVAHAVATRLAPIEACLAPHVARGAIVPLSTPLLEVLVIGPAAEATRRWLSGDVRLAPRTTRAVLPERVWKSVALAPERGTRATVDRGEAAVTQAPLTTASGTKRKTGTTKSASSSSTRRTSR